ncbi:unnamed protein product [Boreogadus saida]
MNVILHWQENITAVLTGVALALENEGKRSTSQWLKLDVGKPINQSCTFSRDGRLIGVGLTGEMSFAAVNRSHEGLYTCTFSGVESPGSWLAVRAPSSPTSLPPSPTSLPPSHPHLLLPLAYAGLPLLLMVLLGAVKLKKLPQRM